MVKRTLYYFGFNIVYFIFIMLITSIDVLNMYENVKAITYSIVIVVSLVPIYYSLKWLFEDSSMKDVLEVMILITIFNVFIILLHYIMLNSSSYNLEEGSVLMLLLMMVCNAIAYPFNMIFEFTNVSAILLFTVYPLLLISIYMVKKKISN